MGKDRFFHLLVRSCEGRFSITGPKHTLGSMEMGPTDKREILPSRNNETRPELRWNAVSSKYRKPLRWRFLFAVESPVLVLASNRSLERQNSRRARQKISPRRLGLDFLLRRVLSKSSFVHLGRYLTDLLEIWHSKCLWTDEERRGLQETRASLLVAQ